MILSIDWRFSVADATKMNQASTETILSTVPSSRRDERLVVVLKQTVAGSQLELRQQSWGDGVGWFTQSRVELDPEQIAALRSTLGTSGMSRPRRPVEKSPPGFFPRVVHAESA